MITYDDFKKVEIRAGKILTAEKIPNTDKLLRLTVDFAEKKEVVAEKVIGDPTTEIAAGSEPAPKTFMPIVRQIVSGISSYFPDPAVLIGKTCMFVTNLEPRMIKGFESNGMLFALSDEAGNFSILEPNSSIKPGTLAK